MKRLLPLAFLLLLLTAGAQEQRFYKETFRPQYHFTPAIHWMNDPNGLVYLDGEYHLFYQFNPFGNRWGHMSWGHAVSRDLVYWQHLPVAIPEEKDTMIFSGSCVVDLNNTSGFATKPGEVPMVAIYTAHIEGLNQSEHIAYSLDKGRSWTKYTHNPVLDLHKKDFRDPKVFWHQSTKKWIMTVALPIEKRLQFYASPNLRDWTLLSEFGPAGDTTGIWECPDLFEVPIQGEPGKTKWVLMHSPAPYMQYFVGDFDGTRFVNENDGHKIYRPDYGPDYYAAITYNNLPTGHAPVSIGWVNNWNYANDIPTTPWKSAMSLPRELYLQRMGNEWILQQRPVAKLTALRGREWKWINKKVNAPSELPVRGQALELEVSYHTPVMGRSGIRVASDKAHYVEIGYDPAQHRVYIDRSRVGGQTDFNPSFAKLNHYEAPLESPKGQLTLRIFLDESIVEVYANGGEAVLTAQLFPTEKANRVELFSEKPAVFDSIRCWEMKSAW